MKWISVLLAVITAGCLVSGCGQPEPSSPTESSQEISESSTVSEEEEITPITMYFFHNTACGSCDGTAEFKDVYSEQLKEIDKDQYPAQVLMYNTFQTSGHQKMEEVAEEWGLDPDDISEPALLINGRIFNGLEAIEKNLQEQYLAAWEDGPVEAAVYKEENTLEDTQLFDGWEADPTHQTVVYFYRITCPECNETKPVIEEIPDNIQVNGEETVIDLVEVNSREGRNGDRIYEFFKAYNVPEEDQMVPIVFFKDSYLAGYDQISAHLTEKLEEGAGLEFAWPEVQE